jgi:hypothetical protein
MRHVQRVLRIAHECDRLKLWLLVAEQLAVDGDHPLGVVALQLLQLLALAQRKAIGLKHRLEASDLAAVVVQRSP